MVYIQFHILFCCTPLIITTSSMRSCFDTTIVETIIVKLNPLIEIYVVVADCSGSNQRLSLSYSLGNADGQCVGTRGRGCNQQKLLIYTFSTHHNYCDCFIPQSHHPTIPSAYHPTVPPAHHPTIPSFHQPTISPSHHSISPPSHHPTIPPFHHSISPLSHHPTIPPSHRPTVPPQLTAIDEPI